MDVERVNFLLPESHKRALNMIAADKGVTASDILREMVEDKIRTYRDGLFFDVTATKELQQQDENVATGEPA